MAANKRRMVGAGAATVLTALATVNAPTAHANDFVRCEFNLATPYIYTLDGVDHVGNRVDASNCQTNLPVTQLTFSMTFIAGGKDGPISIGGGPNVATFTETRDVHDGDNFSVLFPNDDRLIPLLSGMYGTSSRVRSWLPGYLDGRDLGYTCAVNQWPAGGKCVPMVRA
ncbi:MAG: hypothetical protein H6523_14455 [Mycolicibacterium sp.]|nr:hypothetical protein [Mycolicibacterium sp.]